MLRTNLIYINLYFINVINANPLIWNNNANNKAYFFMPIMSRDCKPWNTDCFQETSGVLTECLLDDPTNNECAAYSGPIEWCSFYHEVCSCKIFSDETGQQRSACLTSRQDFDALGQLNSTRTIHAYCSNSWVCGTPAQPNSKSLYELKTFVRENLGYNPFDDSSLFPKNLTPEDFEKLDGLFSSLPLSISLNLRELLTKELSKLTRRSLGAEGPSKTILPFVTNHGNALGVIGQPINEIPINPSTFATYSYIPTSSDVQACHGSDHSQCTGTSLPKEWCMIPPNLKWHGGGCNCEDIPDSVRNGLLSNQACVQQREDLVGNIQWTFCSKANSVDYCKTRYLLNQRKTPLEIWHTPVIPGQADMMFVNVSSGSYECFNNNHCADLIAPKGWCNKQKRSGCACTYVHEGPGRNHVDNKACIVTGVDNTFTYCTENTLANRCY